MPERLRIDDMLAVASEWFWEADRDRTIRALSDNLLRLAGVAPDRWIGQRLDALVGGTGALAPLAVVAPFRDATLRYFDDAGRQRMAVIAGQPRLDRRGRLVGWRGTGRDVTEARDAEDRARQAQELLLGAMESISEGFALYDAEDRLVLFNTNYNFFQGREVSPLRHGVSFEEIVRDAAARGYYPAARGREEAWIQDRIRYHREPQGIFEVELCDHRWLQIIEHRTPSGGTVTINADVTAIKRRDEKQQQAQKLQALGQLTGGVAHDFSNALLLLECNLELVARSIGEGGDPKPHLEGCEAAIGLANGLTQRLLAFARQQPLQPRIVEVNEVVRRMKDFIGRTLPRSIEIETVTSPGLWRVLVDPSQLEAAIVNLSLNSRDAMPSGGVLRIETANVFLERGWAERHHDMRPGSYVTITVSDTGMGMTRDVASRALEPFFTTKSGKGSGLGLSMTYGFIKQSGGELEIESEPGRGTAVRLLLPKVDVGDAPAPGLGEGVTRPARILVLAEDPVERQGLAAMLGDLGYGVLLAADRDTALALLRRELPVDLLLIRGAAADAAAMAREIRPGLPVVTLSAQVATRSVAARRPVDASSPALLRGEIATRVRRALGRPAG